MNKDTLVTQHTLITQLTACTDKQTLAKIADVLNHKHEEKQKDPDARLVTFRVAAARLGISTTTMRRLVKDGSVRAVNVRGKPRVSLASALAYAGVY